MIDISKAFGTSGEPVNEFFQRPGIGFYIPLYQREYSWDDENINQLMQDMVSSVEALLTDPEAILFLGTIILVKEMNPVANIQPQDNRALPSRIDNVIDGQQRISTIALLACLLYQRIYSISKRLPADTMYVDLNSEVKNKLLTLQEIFSVDLRRGRPQRKPIIVRGSVDEWTFDGNEEEKYKSPVSAYLASFIKAINDNKGEFPLAPRQNLVGKNLRLMNKWLSDIEKAYDEQEDITFPPAWRILTSIPEENIWSYPRPELKELIQNNPQPETKLEKKLSSLVQLFAFAHFLLHRCCFTLIEPVNEEWAFDMFQSLNATGTPLTSIETFKPMVVNKVNADANFKGSKSEAYFRQVDKLLSSQSTSAQKNKLTNEYLVTLALTIDGTKLSSQFSKQRRWLNEKYSAIIESSQREEFIRRMGDLAKYWTEVLGFDPSQQIAIPGTEKVDDKERKVAALSILYLKDANHKMANTILSRFYAQILRDEPSADKHFVEAVKAVTAFFTLWRAALPNTGLDDVYRKLLRIDDNSAKMSWEGDPTSLTVDNLKSNLINALNERGVADKASWFNKATQNLTYDNAARVCRFALFVSAHDTIADPDAPGLMKIGKEGSSNYLDPTQWVAPDFKSIEHIAPQRQQLSDNSEWDSELYQNDEYQKIGNLTLLPIEINSSAGNRRWVEKHIYYQHLAEQDLNKLAQLEKEAQDNGVTLKEETISLLRRTSQKHHIYPIVQLAPNSVWDKDFVDKRTARICEILWERIQPWLFSSIQIDV